MAGYRCTKAEKEARIGEIVKLLIRGASRQDVIRFSEKKEWGVRPSSIDKYLHDAWKKIEDKSKFDKNREFGKAVADLSYLFRRAVADGQLSVALSVRKEMSELMGIKKHTKSGNVNLFLDKLPDEVEELFREVLGGGYIGITDGTAETAD